MVLSTDSIQICLGDVLKTDPSKFVGWGYQNPIESPNTIKLHKLALEPLLFFPGNTRFLWSDEFPQMCIKAVVNHINEKLSFLLKITSLSSNNKCNFKLSDM